MDKHLGFHVRQACEDVSIEAILREKELEFWCMIDKELVELSCKMGLVVLPHERQLLICKIMQRLREESKAQEVGAA